MTVTAAAVQSIADIEHVLTDFAKEPNGGLILAPFPLIATNQDRIIALASDLHLPAIYPFRYFATNGGLASYGFDPVEPHRRVASYVDRILKGEKPGNLPVQAPTKYELVVDRQDCERCSASRFRARCNCAPGEACSTEAATVAFMAQSRHGAMSALSPLSGGKRKSDLRAVRSASDPERTWTLCPQGRIN